MLHKMIKKMFYEDIWFLAYRKIDENKYTLIKSSKRYWYADPFLFKHNNEVFIFCEVYDRFYDRGFIGYAKFDLERQFKFNKAICKEYHMSYPCIFEYQGTIYIIPETKQNKTIELYKAKDFPYSWELDCILKDNIEAVDSTVVNFENRLLLYTYINLGKNKVFRVYNLDIENKKLNESEYEDIIDEKLVGRPAGNIIYNEGLYLRPTQDNRKTYGENIFLFEINKNANIFGIKCDKMISTKKIKFEEDCLATKIHTINHCGNIEIIDVCETKFSFIFLFRKIRIKVRNAFRNL